jgi:hypothetical protein
MSRKKPNPVSKDDFRSELTKSLTKLNLIQQYINSVATVLNNTSRTDSDITFTSIETLESCIANLSQEDPAKILKQLSKVMKRRLATKAKEITSTR